MTGDWSDQSTDEVSAQVETPELEKLFGKKKEEIVVTKKELNKISKNRFYI